MRRRVRTAPLLLTAALCLPALALPGLTLAATPASAQTTTTFETVPLEFSLATGPDDGTTCSVLGDLRVPATATAASPAAALLSTNGFGGSKDDMGTQGNASFAEQYAKRGYVTLSYSGLGFGGSGCLIQLDAPEWDGKVADQLAQFLAGRPGLATRTDTGLPYAVPGLVRTEPGLAFDPVAGMIGGSYGGEVQFAAASFGRIDAIVPQITWHDLSYSLAPNNTSQQRGASSPQSVVYATPGTEKVGWTTLFFALGFGQDLTNGQPDQLVRQILAGGTCPNFDSRACTAKIDLDIDGAPNEDTLAFARGASVSTYLPKVDIPVLLSQGQADTLFNLQESIATYSALKAQGNDVKMFWQSWGHSDSSPVPGELDARQAVDATFQSAAYAAWFDHYLLGVGAKPTLDISYYRDWIPSTGDTAADAARQYASAPAYPVAPTRALYLSGSNALVRDPAAVTDGSAQFASVVPAGLPTSYSEIPVVAQNEPVRDTPGTFAQFTTEPLAEDLDLAGVPALTVRLASSAAAAASAAGPPGQLVLFAKLYDIAPDGTITLQHRLVAPSRIASFDEPVRLELPGVVQRIPAGHRLAVVLAASDSGHRGNTLPSDVTVSTTAAEPGVLELPVLAGLNAAAAPAPSASAAAPPAVSPSQAPAASPPPAPAFSPTAGTGTRSATTQATSAGQLPRTGMSDLLPLAGLVLLAAVAAGRRRWARA